MTGFHVGKNDGFEVTDPQKFIKYINSIIREVNPDIDISDEVTDINPECCKNRNTENLEWILITILTNKDGI